MKQKGKAKFRLSRIRVRLFASMVAILTVCFLVIVLAAEPVLYNVLVARTAGSLIEISESIDRLSPNSVTYYFELYSLSVNNNVTLELINPDGSLSYRSAEGSSPQSSNHFPSSNSNESEYASTQQIISYDFDVDGSYEKRRKIATSAEYLVFSKQISTGETLHIFSPAATIDSTVEVATNVFTFICLFIVLLTLIIVYFYVARFTKPLVEMNDVTKDMAALKFERRCRPYGNDEIGELGESINMLSSTLDSTLVDLQEKNIQLEKDIEHRLALDNARKRFIHNVSHELKTPIAIISGYAEGLSAGISNDPEVINEYCDIILEESKKMNSLVVELLNLSMLESKTQSLNPSSYSISQQIKDMLSHFSLLFSNHSINVISDVPDNLDCYAQQDKIEIVLKNYISNAVFHCSEPNNIIINCKDCGNSWRISVFNTGKHIVKEDFDQLWDSFYRADHAHSRSESRFGLGLSIVKAIMELHGMPYGATNSDGGVTFWFEVLKEKD